MFDRQMTMAQPESFPVTYSASRHYHHSAHVASPGPIPTVHTDPATLNIREILSPHGIDTSTLSLTQLDLFRNADAEQRQRLVQMWQLYWESSSHETSIPHSSLAARDFEMTDCAIEVGDEHKRHAEPYMISGYETPAERALNPLRKEPTTGEPYVPSTDPVFQSEQWWSPERTGPMESQSSSKERTQYDTAHGVGRLN